jgi:arylsulfatase A-like enzyme
LNSSNNRAIAFRDITNLYTWMYGVTDPEFAPRQYAADVAALDRRIGELMGALRQGGWLDEMLVVVMADHGEHLNEHSCWYTHAYPYQECLHVPLLVRLPRAQQGGRRVPDEVSLVDLFPTLVEMLGGEAPEGLDGISLVSAMRGEALPARILQAEQGSSPDKYVKSLWDADWRFLSLTMPSRSWVELYDRRRDRAEEHDVAAEHPEVVERFEAELARRFPMESPVVDPGSAPSEPLSEESKARLRSLGYLH